MTNDITRTLDHARQDMIGALIIFAAVTLLAAGLDYIGTPVWVLAFYAVAYIVPVKLFVDAWKMRNAAVEANRVNLTPPPAAPPRIAVNGKEKGKWDAFVDWANGGNTAKEPCLTRYGIGQDTWTEWREDAVALGLGVWIESGGGHALRWVATLNETLAMRDEALRRMEEGQYA